MLGLEGRRIGIGPMGVLGLLASAAGLVLIFKSGHNYPENPAAAIHGGKVIWLGRMFITIALLALASSPTGDPPLTFLDKLLAEMVGPAYFASMMVVDAIAYIALHSKEWCRMDEYVIANIIALPIALPVGLYVYVKSKRLGRLFEARASRGIMLGKVAMSVRRVTAVKVPEGSLGMEVALQGERWEVRRVPGERPYIYDPESRSNPHICMTGSSGVGKTTATTFIISELLRRGYPVIVFDPKGDISLTATSRGWCGGSRSRRVLVLNAGSLGIDPLQKVCSETWVERVFDLINSMDVAEPVGANQKYLIQISADTIGKAGEETYQALLGKVSEIVGEMLSPRGDGGVRYGPHVRDAYMGIRSKMEILSTVFRRNAGFDISILNPDRWGGEVAGVIINLSEIRDRYARAVAMELLLRKLELMLRSRGPLAFLENGMKKVFIVVDEVHELARAQRWRQDTTASILEDMAREARSHGAGLILVTQRLADIPDGIRMNMGLWLSLRTDSPQDIDILRAVVPVGRLPEIVTSLGEGYAVIVEAMPQRLDRIYSIPQKPVAVDEAYIIRLERKFAVMKGSVAALIGGGKAAGEDAAEGVEKAGPADGGGEGEGGAGRPLDEVLEKMSRFLKPEGVLRLRRQLEALEPGEVEKLEKIPEEVLRTYVENLGRRATPELKKLYLEHGLFTERGGRVACSRIGRMIRACVEGSGWAGKG